MSGERDVVQSEIANKIVRNEPAEFFNVVLHRHLVHRAGCREIKREIAEPSCKSAVKLRVTACEIIIEPRCSILWKSHSSRAKMSTLNREEGETP